MQNNELYHHGVKGQKWGVRRYQNKNGSLTSLGRKRRGQTGDSLVSKAAKKIKGSVQTSLANRKARKEAEAEEERIAKEEHKKAKKSIADMSEAEMDERIRRLTKEKMIRGLEQDVSRLSPETKSRGERFLEYSKDIVASSIKDAGKEVMTNYLKKLGAEKLGLNEKSGIDKLKEQKEVLGLKKDIKQIQYDTTQIGKKKENSLSDQKLQTEIDKNLLAIEEGKLRIAKSQQTNTEQNVVEPKPDPKPDKPKEAKPETKSDSSDSSSGGRPLFGSKTNLSNLNSGASKLTIGVGKEAVKAMTQNTQNTSSTIQFKKPYSQTTEGKERLANAGRSETTKTNIEMRKTYQNAANQILSDMSRESYSSGRSYIDALLKNKS